MNELIDEISMGPFGSDITVDNFISEGVPVLNGRNVSRIKLIEDTFNFITSEKAKSLKKANAKRGDIIITYRGTLGQICYIPENSKFTNYVISQSQFRVSLNQKIVFPPYFVYYFHTSEGQKRLLANKNHVGVPALALATTNFKKIEFHLPDINIQKQIASVLSDLDAKIELNRRINTELEAMAKTLYDYWFVQFDFSNKDGKPYKTSGGKMIWDGELKREIPEGWKVGTLLDIAEYTNGIPCQKYRPTGSDSLRVIKIKEMHEGFSSETELVNPDIPSKAIIENGDVLFSWSASLEVQIWGKGKGALNQHIFKVTSTKYPKSYYYFQLINYLQHFKMMADNRKTTMGHITQEHLKQSRIVLPPKELTICLEKIISPIFAIKINNEIENQQLASLRDWLLPMLMNGQVMVGTEEKVSYEVKEVLNVAAEPAGRSYSQKQLLDFYQKQIIGRVIKQHKERDMQHGEMVLAKDLYFLEKIHGVKTQFQFVNWHYGTYDPKIRQLINGKDKYFKKTKVGNNDVEVLDLGEKADNLFNPKYHKPELDLVEEGMNELLSIYSTFPFKERSRRIELLNTVCKVISDTQMLDLESIREAMKQWKTPKAKHKTKADNFTVEETKECIELILQNCWDKKLIG
ncbi:MAG: restriction endonuclease subunit S [Prolixibacteraceae bacterium]|jgi:type I restriction enzyme S subunit